MTFAAQMRLASLEILAALALFAIAVRRLPSPRAVDATSMRVEVDVAPHAMRHAAQRRTLAVAAGSPAILGRAGDAQLTLADPEVSRRHAELQVDEGVLYLRDLASANGTFLNGKRLGSEGIELRPGDYVDVGNTRLYVRQTTAAAWM